jgi:HlyD family secretion protein
MAVIAAEETEDAGETPADAASPWAAIARGRVDIEGGTIRLAAQREGLISEVLVEEGAFVRKGDVLARLDTTAAELGVALAQAELDVASSHVPLIELRLEAARREFNRLMPLARSNAVSRRERDQAGDQVAALERELATAGLQVVAAERRLANQVHEIEARTIRAPLDGRIVRRSAKPGDGASTSTVTELFVLAPTAPRIVRAELDEQMVDAVRPGQEAEIVFEFDSSRVFTGRVLRIGEVFGVARNRDDPNAMQDTRVVELVVSIENGDALRIGQRVLVQVKP